ncbi:MAG: PAS domain-containing sensor histidine kinase [Rhizomicrobium sp.]
MGDEKVAGGGHGAEAASVAPPWGISILSAVVGMVFGLGLTPGGNPEFSAGAAILMALMLAAIGLQRAARPDHRHKTAAEAVRSAFFEHAIEGIFRTTVDGRYLDANPALARIYGYADPSELIAGLTDIAGQLYVDPGRRDAFQALLHQNDAVVDFVSKIRRRDGSTIWISENARAVRNWAGQIVFYEGTVEDVTAKIEAEEAMRLALRQTDEASRAKSAFLAAMSHELKTPLNAVLGFSEMLKCELLGPLGQPAYRRYAEDIHVSGMRLLAVIDDILDVARVQTSAITLDVRPVPLADVARDAVAQAKRATGDPREVAIDLPDALPFVRVDPGRLCQALLKILSNAFKFTPENGAISLVVRLTEDGRAAITISDEGIGMEPEKIALALEPFGQIDRSLARRFEGAGLGLTIARALVELHGGELSIASEQGRGTAVTIFLPACAVVQAEPGHSQRIAQ